jgi:ABC-2 type transport system ATP-binding protein
VAGFVEGPRFYPYLSGRKNLALLADYDSPSSRPRIDEVLELVELRDRAKDRVGGYSHGMRQRLGIAASLLRQPRLLLLDEPTTGLDPAGMRDMRDLVRRLAAEGITIVLSSHILAEVEELCNRVAIIRQGSVIYQGSLSELMATAASGYRLRALEPERARAVLLTHAGAEDVELRDGELRFKADEQAVAALTVALGQARIAFTALVPESASRPTTTVERCSRCDGRRPRLPLGAREAPRPEAHLPRARRRGDRAGHLRGRAPAAEGRPERRAARPLPP